MGAKENLAAQTERIEFLLSQIMRGMFRSDHKHRARWRRRGMDLTLAQVRVMGIIGENDNCRMNEIAKMVGISMPTLTGIVNRLVRAGILARRRDENDRRAVRIRFTGKGKNLRDRHRRHRTERIAKMLERLDAGERAELADSMEKTYSIISKLAANRDHSFGGKDSNPTRAEAK